ncbi:L-histidine N(alpha)-methyltransferase [Stackebrandtia nassauensis]|uniref:Histidine N-alpha-methyltransferase n=1 Tax=Stackebrandtia nassauensis (strain DSM 44728 / CIP 108903 / NRRL B-16338 / NBRC 102104 / LLR-40K-21) TaxID=446470 RepID=D3QBR7_STANL|nr:L-histidine N(alpha)-methyltransferase [Stackebrandtia nassauensis]ADD44806.1 methyltransferase [Stackebrandtia nassauensis DSM 44728]
MLESHISEGDLDAALRADVVAGLTATPKRLPPKWFYDAHGSDLFEEITRLPEYYPTRAEAAALESGADRVAERTGATSLVELGSGSSRKTLLLIDALRRKGTLDSFVGFDVSSDALAAATAALSLRYPELSVSGIVGDFTEHLRHLPSGTSRLVAFLGGTIGNLLPAARADFLASLRTQLAPGEWLLLGTDLVKDPATLVAAYDDAAGVTARFNRNVLTVLNRRLDANFDVEAFTHVALWDAEAEWIEMRLRADRPMRVELPAVGLSVDFAAGEELRTEISAKFHLSGLAAELGTAGFAVSDWWTDPKGRFGLSLAEAV